jgi:hypothetical protein
MRQDLRSWIARCPECQIATRPLTNQQVTPLHPLPIAENPFGRWGLDFIGILPETKKGNRWLLVAIDYATNWPVGKELPEAMEEVVADFLYHDIMINYGPPKEFLQIEVPTLWLKH